MNTADTGMVAEKMSQADENFAAFQKLLPELLLTHGGKYALMQDRKIVEFFDSIADAVRFGVSKFGTPEKFSVQQVTNQNISLGLYAYAVHQFSN